MKTKNMFLGLAGMSLFLFSGLVGSASGSVSCNDATIVQVGLGVEGSNPDYFVKMICNDTNPARWTTARTYHVVSDLGKSGYATILTAMSLDRHLKVTVSSTATHSLLEDMQILPAAP